MPGRWKAIMTICLVAMTAGCAANREARELASRLRKLTAEYESIATKKTAAEKQFYLDSLKDLDHTLNVVDLTKQPADVKETVAYGRILTRANYDSMRLAESMIRGDEALFTAGTISEFIRDGIRADEDAYAHARQLRATIAESLSLDLSRLAEYQKKLAELSRGLADLEQTPDSAARFKQLRALGEAVWLQLRADQDAVR